MNLREEIKKLVRLQEIDSQIYTLREEKETVIPAQLEALHKGFEEKKGILTSFEQEAKSLQIKRKEKELELATKEEGVRKAQAQLYQLKTNKEYQAKMSEIASLKADVSLLEEGVLKVMEVIEETEKKSRQAKSEVASQEKAFRSKEAELKSAMKEKEAQIKELEKKREVFLKEVDGAVAAKYEQLLRKRSGLAVVPVKNGNCGACHMILTPQQINQIKMYTELVFCENCVRMLYISEEDE